MTCADVRPLLADLDGERLDVVQSTAMLRHLLGCPGCRAELDDLRRVRQLLRGAAAPAPVRKSELDRRLLAIAGATAAEPLYLRPRGPGTLPSARRRRARTMRVSASSLTALLLLAVVAGWRAAPEIVAVAPAVEEAHALLHGDPLQGARIISTPARSEISREGTIALTADEARGTLARAEAVPVGYTATLVVLHATRSGQARVSRTPVSADPLTGAVRAAGRDVTGGAPAAPLGKGLDSVTQRHDLSGSVLPQTVDGHAVTLIEASRHGVVAARWWVVSSLKLVIRVETYDHSGRVKAASALEDLAVSDAPAPGLALIVGSDEPATPLSCAQPLACPTRLAGLPLTAISAAAGRTQLFYGDGVSSVVVVEQPGRLRITAGLERCGVLRCAQDESGALVWEANGVVFTLVADGADQLAGTAASGLPQPEGSSFDGVRTRVWSGWMELLGRR